MLPRSIAACLGLLGMLMATQAAASISLNATRIVFDGDHKEANITVRNGNQDVLIQSWVDMNDASGSRAPFAVTPPLARVFAKEQQLLRILYEGKGMPTDRESVVWLNVQEIPKASETENTLQLAIRQRIKILPPCRPHRQRAASTCTARMDAGQTRQPDAVAGEKPDAVPRVHGGHQSAGATGQRLHHDCARRGKTVPAQCANRQRRSAVVVFQHQ